MEEVGGYTNTNVVLGYPGKAQMSFVSILRSCRYLVDRHFSLSSQFVMFES